VSKKILIVEDEFDIRVALVAWLEDEEFEVSEAGDGFAGLQEFERVHPDLVLLDMNMPGMNGVELCRNIRQVSEIPIVMFVSAADAGEVQKAIAVGATDIVLKHTGFDVLVDRISHHLHVKRHSISESELEEAMPAQALTLPESPSDEMDSVTEVDSEGVLRAPEHPGRDDLWTWNGEYFGFREGRDLWTHDGRHVGRFRQVDEVYRCDGTYMGDVIDGRLIVDWNKMARRASSFNSSDNRVGHERFADREAFNMMVGYKDFPGPEEV
jgi:CheY-like chemotaxis protein